MIIAIKKIFHYIIQSKKKLNKNTSDIKKQYTFNNKIITKHKNKIN